MVDVVIGVFVQKKHDDIRTSFFVKTPLFQHAIYFLHVSELKEFDVLLNKVY